MPNQTVTYTLNLQNQLSPAIRSATVDAGALDEKMNHLTETAMHVAGAFGIAFGIHKIKEFAEEILNVTAEFEGFENVIRYASISEKDAATNLDYIANAVTRLHLPMKEAYEQFSEMQGGMYGTGIEGEKLRGVFEGVAEASTVMHLNADKFSRTVYALKEIGELGTVQMRQMRMLAMALPGAMSLAAQSMNMNSHQFHEAMKKGELNSADFLVAFSAKLKEHFGAGLAQAGDSLISKMNDTKTQFTKLMLQMGEDLRPAFVSLMNNLMAFVGVLKEAWGWLMDHKGLMRDVGELILIAAAAWGAYTVYQLGAVAVTKISVAWEAIQYASIMLLGDGMLTASAFTKLMAGAQVMLNAAMEANPIGFIIAGVAALVAVIVVCYNRFSWFRGGIWALWYVIKEFGAILVDYMKGLYDVIMGTLTMDPKQFQKGWGELESSTFGAFKRIGNAAVEGYNEGVKDFAKDNPTGKTNSPKKVAVAGGATGSGGEIGGKEKKETSKATGNKSTTINIKIDNLVRSFSVNTTNMQGGASKAKEIVAQALLSAVNDSQIVAGS